MPDPTPSTPTTTPATKPGWKTTEFWLGTILKLFGMAVGAGYIAPDSPTVVKVAGFAITALSYLGYTVSRTQVKKSGATALDGQVLDTNVAVTTSSQAGFVRLPLLIAITLVLAVAGVFASGCTNNDRRDTIHATLVTVDAARDGFLAYDQAHQAEIVQTAIGADDARAKLAAYRADRDRATGPAGLLTTAYRAIAAAATANDAASLTAMTNAAIQLESALKPYVGGGK
jgi:hypothetical protein